MFLVGTVFVKGSWFPCKIRKERDKLYCTILDTLTSSRLGVNGLEIEFPRGDTRVRYNPKWAKNSMADEANVSDNGRDEDDMIAYELDSIDEVSVATTSVYTLSDSTEVIFPPNYLLEPADNDEDEMEEGKIGHPHYQVENEFHHHFNNESVIDVFVPFDHRKINYQQQAEQKLARKERLLKAQNRRRNSEQMLSILRKETVTNKTFVGGEGASGDVKRKKVFVRKKGFKSSPNYAEFGCSAEDFAAMQRFKQKEIEERNNPTLSVPVWKRMFGCFSTSKDPPKL